MDLKSVLVGSLVIGTTGCGWMCGPKKEFTDVSLAFTRDEMDHLLRVSEGEDPCRWLARRLPRFQASRGGRG